MLPLRVRAPDRLCDVQVLKMVYDKGGVRLWACLACVSTHYRDAMDDQMEVAKQAEPRMIRLIEDTMQCDAQLLPARRARAWELPVTACCTGRLGHELRRARTLCTARSPEDPESLRLPV